MDNLYNALVTYYETLFKSGYMSVKKPKELLVLMFLVEFMQDPDYLLITTSKERGIVNQLYNNIVTKNCLI